MASVARGSRSSPDGSRWSPTAPSPTPVAKFETIEATARKAAAEVESAEEAVSDAVEVLEDGGSDETSASVGDDLQRDGLVEAHGVRMRGEPSEVKKGDGEGESTSGVLLLAKEIEDERPGDGSVVRSSSSPPDSHRTRVLTCRAAGPCFDR